MNMQQAIQITDKFMEDTKEYVLNYPTRELSLIPRYWAVIVEPRCHPWLEYVCKLVCRFTNNDFGIHVFHGTENEEFVKQRLKNMNVKYSNLGVANLTIPDYNNLFTSPAFYDQIDSDVFLIFQTDIVLFKDLDPSFLKYDYLGAPWPHLRNRIGNGGLCIRNKQFIMNCLKNRKRRTHENEDVFFSNYAYSTNANIPDYNTACKFSSENNIVHEIPFGCHKFIHNIRVPDLKQTFINSFL